MIVEARRIPPKVYVTNHHNSKVVCQYLAHGSRGQLVSPPELYDGEAITWGILRGCNEVIWKAHVAGRDWFHVDHGYLKSSNGTSFYRLTKNALQLSNAMHFSNNFSYEDRLNNLKLDLKPYNTSGYNVVVCGLSELYAKHHPLLKLDKDEFERTVVKELLMYTDRPVIVKDKHHGSFRELLPSTYCVVTYTSNAAIEAAVHGVPSITLGECAADAISAVRLDQVDDFPSWDGRLWEERRQHLFRVLANNQFTLEELAKHSTWDTCLNEHNR